MSASVMRAGRAFNPKAARTSVRRLRAKLEQAVEDAINALDAFDGEADLEASLQVETMLDQRIWAKRVGCDDDRETDSEDEGAQCDDEGMCGSLDPDSEPALGSQEADKGGTVWYPIGQGAIGYDGEVDCLTVADLDQARAAYRARGGRSNIGPLVRVQTRKGVVQIRGLSIR